MISWILFLIVGIVQHTQMEAEESGAVPTLLWSAYDKKDTWEVVRKELDPSHVYEWQHITKAALFRQATVDPILLEHFVLNQTGPFDRLIWHTILSYSRPVVVLLENSHTLSTILTGFVPILGTLPNFQENKQNKIRKLMELMKLGTEHYFYAATLIDFVFCQWIVRGLHSIHNYFLPSHSSLTTSPHMCSKCFQLLQTNISQFQISI